MKMLFNNEKMNRYARLRQEYLSKELLKEIQVIPVVITKSGLLHKQSRYELERLGIKLNWKTIIRTIIIQNAIDVLTYLSSRLRASGKTNLEDSENDEDSQCESLLISEESEDNKSIEDTIVID